ncbi:Methyl-accepting chemotaxis protein I (serine chemoreceptor protein) [Cupriavidus basilensis]|uniref:Methyl-accepting chemotaxis protein I (Serine chemoreceptor protein) n=2 Tax=Cupriavidus basilensis TaxID=68895 RepID=A0A0C4YM43_9BURK|nr:Methyl-accepting chemotaxis protein I (serine chemoreceptor protein) [Cupriavidus basilensis]
MLNWFKSVRIGTRLTAAFSINVFMLLVIAVVALQKMATMDANTELIVSDLNNKILEFHGLKDRAAHTAIMLRDLALVQDAGQMEKSIAKIAQLRAVNEEKIRGMANIFYTEKGKALYKDLAAADARYWARVTIVIDGVREGDSEKARAELTGELSTAQASYFAPLDALMEVGKAVSAKESAEATEAYRAAKVWLLGALALAVLAAVVSAVRITRSVTQPVGEAVKAARALAQGDLSYSVVATSGDEIGELMQALERAFTQLRSLILNIQVASGSVDSAAHEIAQGNTDLSQRTEQQAASLQQTAASMEELTSTVNQNAGNARAARRQAQDAIGVADNGAATVKGVEEVMQGIAAAATRMADIIGAVEGIAFQTNILALNAAVEAARAGEQGRGFAVVAGEVRTLAQRSSAAAKEIRDLIASSMQQADAGTGRVAEAGAAMDRIVASVRQVTTLIEEIAEASEEQSTGIEQVNQAVAQMDQVTQQNAALVEQAAAAAESLREQASRLVADAGTFRVEAGAPAGAEQKMRALM